MLRSLRDGRTIRLLVTLGLAARPGRFPSDSGKTHPRFAAAGLLPLLWSKLPCAAILALRVRNLRLTEEENQVIARRGLMG